VQNRLMCEIIEALQAIAKKNDAPTAMWTRCEDGFVACISKGNGDAFMAGKFTSLAEVADWHERMMDSGD